MPVSFVVYDAVCICTSLYSRMICGEREKILKWFWPKKVLWDLEIREDPQSG